MRFHQRIWAMAITLALVVLAVVGGLRIAHVNSHWPAISWQRATPGGAIDLDGLEFSAVSTDLYTASQAEKLGYVLPKTNTEAVRVVVAKLAITNRSTTPRTIDVTSWAFQSGAWRNGSDPMACAKFNPGLKPTSLKIPAKHTVSPLLVTDMYSSQLPSSEWEHLQDRAYSLVLVQYPTGYELQLPSPH